MLCYAYGNKAARVAQEKVGTLISCWLQWAWWWTQQQTLWNHKQATLKPCAGAEDSKPLGPTTHVERQAAESDVKLLAGSLSMPKPFGASPFNLSCPLASAPQTLRAAPVASKTLASQRLQPLPHLYWEHSAAAAWDGASHLLAAEPATTRILCMAAPADFFFILRCACTQEPGILQLAGQALRPPWLFNEPDPATHCYAAPSLPEATSLGHLGS